MWPIHPNSFGKNKYILHFIDKFSRKTKVYFFKEKHEVFSVFKKFKAVDEKESDHNIKTMKSDKGGKFSSKEFEKYCENHGIRFLKKRKSHKSLTSYFYQTISNLLY